MTVDEGMKKQLVKQTSFLLGIVPIASLFFTSFTHANSNHSTSGSSYKNTPKDSPAFDVVDSYLDKILCDNKSVKLWNENLRLGVSTSPPASLQSIEKAFASEIFYSLPSGLESKGAKIIRETHSDATKILNSLRTLAVFFGHDFHNLHASENSKRVARGEAAISKGEFFRKFYTGDIIIKTEGVSSLRDFIQSHIDQVELLTKKMNYGCLGDKNFLHRKDSQLSQTISPTTFLLPTTASATATTSHAIANKEPEPQTEIRKPAAHLGIQNTQKPVSETRSRRFKHYQKFLSAGVPKSALDEAMSYYFAHKSRNDEISEHRMVVVDYTLHSAKPRFWVINLQTGNATGMLMGHGNGQGALSSQKMPAERVSFVSNVLGSNASSAGSMILNGRKTQSRFKYAVNVSGLESRNSNVEKRSIIVHEGVNRGGVYVDDDSGERAGRSEGCFALSPQNAKWVAENLPAGTFLYAYSGNIPNVNTRSEAQRALR